MELAGKVAVVTGGASGIGAALCRAFAAEGAAGIVVGDLDGDGAQRTVESVGATGGRTEAVAVAGDVADEAYNRALVAAAEDRFGPVDLLCLNAGIGVEGGVEAADESWQRAWDVNVMAHVLGARAVLPSMLERGSGWLLHTASAAGLLTNLGAAPYAVTKHAVVALAEWLAITHGDAGIGVSCLCPMAVNTPMLAAGAGGMAAAAAAGAGVKEPDEVAAVVVEGLRREQFLILPHPEVAEFERYRAADRDRWLAGMRRAQRALSS